MRVSQGPDDCRRAHASIHSTTTERRRASLEKRFGAMADTFLVKRGIVKDAESRQKLIEHLSIDLSEAAKKLDCQAYKPRMPGQTV